MAGYVVGLTGGIGSGKTAASDYLKGLGISIVDADVIAREVVEPGTPCLNAIKEHFGAEVIQANGELDRKALRHIVFADAEQKTWLNQLLHPAIRREIQQQLQQAQSAYVVLVAPLLFENGLEQYCDRTLVIDVPETLQLARTTQRDNVDANNVQAIIDSQISRQERLHRADDVVVNDKDLTHLKQQLLAVDKDYRVKALNKAN